MFADKLKELRNEKSITQVELADAIHVSRSLVAKWEQGKALPTEDSLKEISEYFDVDINILISDRELHDNTKRTKKNYKHIIITLIIVAIITLGTSLGMLCSFYNNIDHELENHVVESATYNYADERYTNIKFESTDIEYNYESSDPISPDFMINGQKRDFNYSTFEIKAGDTVTLGITWTLHMNAYNQIRTKEYHIDGLDFYVTNIDLTKQLTGIYIDLSGLENEPNIYSDKNNSSTSGWDISDLSFNPSSSIYFNIGSETKEENTYNYTDNGMCTWNSYYGQCNDTKYEQWNDNTDFHMNFETLIDFNKLSNVTTSSGHKIDEMHFWYLYSDGTYSDQIIDNYHTNPIIIPNTIPIEKDSAPALSGLAGQILTKYLQENSNDLSFQDLQFSVDFTNQITPSYKIIRFDENDNSLSTQFVNSTADLDEITNVEDTSYMVIIKYQNGEEIETTVVTPHTFSPPLCFSSKYGLFNSENTKWAKF